MQAFSQVFLHTCCMEIARFEVAYRLNYARWRVGLGQNLAFWRRERRMKQWEVGLVLRVSQSTISRIERGRGYLPFDRLCMLSTYLEVTLAVLMEGLV